MRGSQDEATDPYVNKDKSDVIQLQISLIRLAFKLVHVTRCYLRFGCINFDFNIKLNSVNMNLTKYNGSVNSYKSEKKNILHFRLVHCI